MTALLALYSLVTGLLEPLAGAVIRHRLRSGKERPERASERFGRTLAQRPDGCLVWLHAASVGEMRVVTDLYFGLKARHPDLSAVLTTQTLTSADLAASLGAPGLIHQMAPIDAPGAIQRFLDRWRPAALILAEGEIWPNMLLKAKARGASLALVNARMTTRSIEGWSRVRRTARKLFASFAFIGAADEATARGISALVGRSVSVCGNLKQAVKPVPPSRESLLLLSSRLDGRPVVLAASTHPGEEDFALEAFQILRVRHPNALLVIAPRHPERGGAVLEACQSRGYTVQRRSIDPTPPRPEADILLADTMGEMPLLLASATGVFLGGATAEGIGGHNPIEPAALGRRTVTGPNGFNFAQMFKDLQGLGALEIATTPGEVAAFWARELTRPSLDTTAIEALMEDAAAAREATLDALSALIEGPAGHA
jgi:3-deoxy-D-manno-octulosonic-acid transferase